MNDLPLSIIVEIWKYKDVNLDDSAIHTLNNLLSDLLKPRRSGIQNYKNPMKYIKKRTSQNKEVILSPRSPYN